MRLLTNHTLTNHHEQFLALMKDADEVWLATAFLKESGLSKILHSIKCLVESDKRVTIIVGQNFGLTDPKSLYVLREVFEKNKGGRLYLAHANKPYEVFHPKVSLFRIGNVIHIIAGSSNITEGGLVTNFECSLFFTGAPEENVVKDSFAYFDILTSVRVSLPASLLVIKQYETFYESQKQHNKEIQSIPNKTTIQEKFTYENLIKYILDFDNNDRKRLQQEREKQYQEAKTILIEIADDYQLDKGKFSSLLDRLVGRKGQRSLWHSGSLFRLRKNVYPHYRHFKSLVQFVRGNQERPISEIYDGAKAIVARIEGAAANYIAEIMMTFNPTECANINRNPLTVLREAAGIQLKAHSSSFTGKDYQEYCAIIKDISQTFSLKNMLEADSFFNEIYWKIYDSQDK